MEKNKPVKHGEDYYVKVLLKEVKLKEIMTASPVCVHVDEPFVHVPQKMKEHGIRHIPVVDYRDKVIGIVTQRDLYKIQPPRRMIDGTWYYEDTMFSDTILERVMVKNPRTMHEDDSIGDALIVMVKQKYGSIIVVDADGILKGIITAIDLLRFAAEIYTT